MKPLAHFASYMQYRRNRRQLVEQMGANTEFPLGRPYPCLRDRYEAAGTAKGHYFFMDLHVARRVHALAPARHVDIGSRMDGFVAHVASFREVEVLDIRALDAVLPGITFHQCDIMGDLPPQWAGCSDSVSCLHAIEHFGLGRYGDPICLDGHLRGFANLARMVRPGGRLHLATPIGPQRIEFDAHRVFALDYWIRQAAPQFDLARFSFVDDAGQLHDDVPVTPALAANHAGCRFGCGIYEFVRKH